MQPATMKDIARKAKVSRPTVSLILNGKCSSVRISEGTREKVLEIAKELGYRRNEIARSMVTGKTNIIGFSGDISWEYTSLALKGVVEAAEKSRYFVKIFTYDNKNFQEDLAKILEQRPAGLIFRSLSREKFEFAFKECLRFQTPLAVVGSSFSASHGIRVISKDVCGASMAVRHLAELGHKKIGHASASLSNGFVQLRLKGYLEEMKKLGLKVDEKYIVHEEDGKKREKKMLKLFSAKNHPSAVFCASDPIAMQTIRAARKAGLKIPEDISIVGYANMNASKYSDPPLTTIEEPFLEMGRTVGMEIINEIESKEKLSFKRQIQKSLDVKLIVRESTAPPNKNI